MPQSIEEKKKYRKQYYQKNKLRLQKLGREYHKKKYIKKVHFRGEKIKRSFTQYGLFLLSFD